MATKKKELLEQEAPVPETTALEDSPVPSEDTTAPDSAPVDGEDLNALLAAMDQPDSAPPSDDTTGDLPELTEAEVFGDVIRNVAQAVAVVDLVPCVLHCSAFLLSRTAGTGITAEEEGFYGSLEFVKLGLRGKVLGIVGNEFRAKAVICQLFDSVGVLHGTFADLDDLTHLQHPGRFGIHATDLHLASLTGVSGLCPGLENPDGPEDFVDSLCVRHNQLCHSRTWGSGACASSMESGSTS